MAVQSDGGDAQLPLDTQRRRILIGKSTSSALLFPLLTTRVPQAALATTTDPKTGISQPEPGEIEAAIPTEWSNVDNPFDTTITDESNNSLFGRLDQQPDSAFYESPRFVEHIDENAVRLLTEYNTKVLTSAATAARETNNNSADAVRVLDLCSSWTSHMDPKETSGADSRVYGLGMNAKELESNTALTDWTVQDLNQNPRLIKYNDDSFDVVLCQLSIDYLTRPLEVLREVSRVLRVGGTIHILFSNRLFLQKAVALWAGADDVDHAYFVGCYLYFCGGSFRDIKAQDLSTRKGRDKRIVGDPLFVVSAVKG